MKPGLLTNQFNNGNRVRYTTPVRLLLISSVLFYALLSISSNLELTKDGLIFKRAKVDGFLSAKETEEEIPEKTTTSNEIKTADENLVLNNATESESNDINIITMFGNNFNQAISMLLSSEKEYTVKEVLDSTEITNPFLVIGIKQVKRMKDEGTDNFINYFVQHISITIFLLIPIFALIMKLIYIRSSYYYINHLVHIIHLNTVVYFLSILGLLASFFISILPIMFLVITYYQYKSMRTVYKQGRLKTLVKFSIHSFVSFIITMVGLTGTLIISFFLF